MPKGKKKFIDRKSAVTFHLVHRSQQDPLINDEDAPQHVLLPTVEKTTKAGGPESQAELEQRKEEQRKWGISWDDGYDYLQHLRGAGEGPESELVRYRIMAPQPPADKAAKLKLPSSVFASSVEEDVGLLNLAAPHPGPRLDLDPDVVAAMDEDFNYDDPDNMLDDDFVQLANGGIDGGEENDDSSDLDSIEEEEDVSSGGSAGSGEASDDDVASLRGSQFTFADEETKSRFTNYSVSSSVIRRNEQLEILDSRFEKMFAGYDDNEIGALDCEEIDGYLAPDSDAVLRCAEEFSRDRESLGREPGPSARDVEMGAVSSGEEEGELVALEVRDRDRLDCESVLSTYSNLYNHPTLIAEPAVSRRIRVSARTGMPAGVLDPAPAGRLTARALARHDATAAGPRRAAPDGDGTETVLSSLSVLSLRPRGERAEGRRERKKSLKEYRKERRLEKKANTLAFKEEKKRQERNALNMRASLQTVRIL
ncbi:protein LTV1 homolog [Bacillus rossius redtenbacheri]|uniref:protein LTV1 homolog n=1 Tax=Bacillus rossius redtenbacheri TaxID=93214 RepID=UPI002FDE6579